MRAVYPVLFLLEILRLANGVCVLESEFGFILNCNFKKSGLFRVRNLGGLKTHFGLGFSFGDELGFSESLGNLEGNRRRALHYVTGYSNKIENTSPKIKSSDNRPSDLNIDRNLAHNGNISMTEAIFLPPGVPSFRHIPTLSNSYIRRSHILLPSGTTESTLSANETNVFHDTHNVMNSFTGNAIKSAFKNSTYNTEDDRGQNQINKMIDKPISLDLDYWNKENTQVMNAPKEYYPFGYDKNFDDNFGSKVILPSKSFSCAEQKYFPGLYANIKLGCMVFHVCAITKDGIVMKSFLCPESTLFDQSILKCNWWFYVDCGNSTYDSNIPVSKSYQLIKSFSYLANKTKI